MYKRLPPLLITALSVAALGGTTGVAAAKHGADDPAGHVRHARGADDVKARAARHGADDPAGHVRHARGADDVKARAARHGADDPAGHVRHARGADDGPNHG